MSLKELMVSVDRMREDGSLPPVNVKFAIFSLRATLRRSKEVESYSAWISLRIARFLCRVCRSEPCSLMIFSLSVLFVA